MNDKPRYLTKSRFKLALECPTKLFYTGKPALYPDAKQQDEFMQALAEGGFQVGELAKLMYPGGIEVAARGHAEQLEETRRLLEQDEVTVFEAAILYDGLFVRIDVLRKVGMDIDLIEVKAKSFDSTAKNPLGGAGMRPYLLDVAFQRHVLRSARPDLRVNSFLMLADKSRACTTDGLNQRFRISRHDGRPVIAVVPGTDAQVLGAPVLTCTGVDGLIDQMLADGIEAPGANGTLADLARDWADHYQVDRRIAPTIGSQCARCEFNFMGAPEQGRSGVKECWRAAAGFTDQDFADGSVLDLWNFRGKQALIDDRVLRLSDVTRERLGGKPGDDGLSASERQWMQVSGEWPGRPDFYIDAELMKREMARWKFPLNFIDFETARVAIPFFAGQRPYANIAFQFSHHVVEAGGRVDHRSEFLCTTPGKNPNYDFARALMVALDNPGTVFMWSPHENTTLNEILKELAHDPAPPADRGELVEFLRSLTTRKVDKRVEAGPRAMVDLCHLAERAFFHPSTKGSNSIKKVLPAVMQASDFLRRHYAQSAYGATGGIRSRNFKDHVWWQERDGFVLDPYKLLPSVFSDLPPDVLGAIDAADDLQIAQGGAATMAYARLQFDDTAQHEREHIEAALRRYCELDTLAMVMVWQAWRDWC